MVSRIGRVMRQNPYKECYKDKQTIVNIDVCLLKTQF